MNRKVSGLEGKEGSGPFGGPIASSDTAPSPQADHEYTPRSPAKYGAPWGTITTEPQPKRPYASQTTIDAISDRLSSRDRAILQSVDEHQFLTARHIGILHFDSIAPDARSRITRRVLSRLRELRVLAATERQIGGVHAGSQSLVHRVGPVGDRILHDRTDRARRTSEPSLRFLRHRMAVADAHVALIAADREAQIDLESSVVEPATSRAFTGPGASRRIIKPDLYAETAASRDSEFVQAWFIEVDLGTESIPTLLRKCRDYAAYRQSGIEQDQHGSFPIVIWSITHRDPAKADNRRQALTAAIVADRGLPNALFRIVAPEQLLPLIQSGGTL